MITLEQLEAAIGAPADRAALWLDPLNAAMERFNIGVSRLRVAAFLSQCAHETDDFTVFVENLNYSAAGLIETWPHHFNTVNAGAYAHDAQKIANFVYAGELGNGDAASGDGWAFRGKGPTQTTGRTAHALAGHALGYDLVTRPMMVIIPAVGAMVAAWDWAEYLQLNELADQLRTFPERIDMVTRKLNGGLIGVEDRREKFRRACDALGI